MDQKRLRIGELLIEAGVLNHTQLRQALELQKQQPKPLGMILAENRFVTEAQLIQALSRQLSIPWVSLWHVDVAPELLAIVTREEAEQHHILPIYARTVRGERPALFVAMDDPTNQQALEFVREVAGMEVRPMIAAPTDLRQAIKALYSGEEEEEELEEPPPPPIMPRRSAPPPPPRIARSAPPPPADDAVELTEPADEEAEAEDAPEPGSLDLEAGLAAASSVPPESEEAVAEPAAAEEPDGPSFQVPGAIESGAAPEPPEVTGVGPAPEPPEVTGVGPAPEPSGPGRAAVLQVSEATRLQHRRRALAFTFLDGTSIAVGGGDTVASVAADRPRLDDLIATLRRYADDPNVPEPYGARGLSVVVAALLEILSRKGLVSEAEWSETIARQTREH